MDKTNPSSDGLTRQEVWKLLDTYNQQWRDGHERMRNAMDRNTQAMTDGFNGLRTLLATHEEADRKVERRVDHLEIQEDARTKRYMTMSGIVSLIVGPASAWLFKKLFP